MHTYSGSTTNYDSTTISGKALKLFFTGILCCAAIHCIFHVHRIVLRPTTLNEDEYCSFEGNCSTTNISDVLAASTVTFEREINSTFSLLNSRSNSSIHGFMDAQTEQIICQDLKFGFEACPEPDTSLPGFQTRIEKAYVVLFVFFGACSVTLGIVLLAVCYEDRVMKAEGKASSSGDRMLRNNNMRRERPLSDFSMQSNEEG